MNITSKSCTSRNCKEAVERLDRVIKGLSSVVIGRNDLLRQIMFALITKNHILIEGPPGIAKSYCANKLFSCITGASTFKVQCTRKMSEDYIVGPLDMKVFREEGRYTHLVEGSIVTSDLAFVDEFMDLSPNTLRALLEVLNERTFTRGVQRVSSSLWTAIACTNFGGDNEGALEAVLDRFLFKAKLSPLSSKEHKKLMLQTKGDPHFSVSMRDIRIINKEIQKVTIPDHILDVYLDICSELNVTDRYLKKALDVVRASAVIRGGLVAKISDLSSLDVTMMVAGDNSSASNWARVFCNHYRPAIASEERIRNLKLVCVRTSELDSMLEDLLQREDLEYDDVHPIACEAREAEHALNELNFPHGKALYERAMKRVNHIYNKASILYRNSQPKL